jgi:hypothetical protein
LEEQEEYEDKHSRHRDSKREKSVKVPMRGNRSVFLIEQELNKKGRAYGRKRKKPKNTS